MADSEPPAIRFIATFALKRRSTAQMLSLIGSSSILVAGGPGSSVGIATGYGLDGPGIEYRWGARFSAPV